MGSLYDRLHGRQVRIGLVAPFFTDTAILGADVRVMLAGVPFANIGRVRLVQSMLQSTVASTELL